jgi:NADH dehydrogenase FAD-containing subunit
VFALGDISQGHPESSGSSSGQVYPATAQVAFQQADYAAWNIWSAINGRSLLPFRCSLSLAQHTLLPLLE